MLYSHSPKKVRFLSCCSLELDGHEYTLYIGTYISTIFPIINISYEMT